MILALYLRLSKKNEDMVDESNSITNQRHILHRYVQQNLCLSSFEIQEYIDDGYSGRNFERPGIIKLFEDLKIGKVYGIIVKDFSRFGRNHIEVGNYIEKIFPLLDIRFIAVNNSFDSNDYIGTTPDMDVVFENLMYDYFSEENSIKIKNDLLNKRMRGNYMATFATYGYIKHPENHNRLLIDEEAAQVVRLIFEKYLEYGVKAEVARYLNSYNILTPQEYAKRKGMDYRWKYKEGKKLWNGSIVGRILKNPIYIGNTVFHKKEVVEVGSRRTRCLPKEEWKICEKTHEAIVSKHLFELVNRKNVETQVIKQKKCKEGLKKPLDVTIYCEGEKRRRGEKNSPIKGFVKCGGCRHSMTRRNRRNASYYCRYHYANKDKECCSQNIKEVDLQEMVLSSIRCEAMLIADLQQLYELNLEVVNKINQQRNRKIQKVQKKIEKYNTEKFKLYERYKREEIDRDEFVTLKQKNNKVVEQYNNELEQYALNKEGCLADNIDIFRVFGDKVSITELTRDIVEQLVSVIYVYSNNRVEIVFKYRDEIEKLLVLTKKSE